MEVIGADFLLSFKCPANCVHCAYCAGPNLEGSMNIHDINKWLKCLVDTQPINSVGAHGVQWQSRVDRKHVR